MREEEGKAVFERDGQGKVLKAKDRILTLTGREAVSCGLAVGLVQGVETIGQHLAVSDWQAIGGQEQAEAAAFDVPAVLGPKAFATPDTLYSLLNRKFASLGLTEEQTEIYIDKAVEEWKKWFAAQRFSGKQVTWSLTLLEASENWIRLVPDVEYTRRKVGPNRYICIPERFGEREPELGGSVRGPNMTTGVFSSLWAFRDESFRARKIQRANERYPIKVTAKCDNEPRIFHMVAWVSARSREALTQVDPESEIRLSGKIGKVVPYLSPDGIFTIEVILDECQLVQEGAEPAAPEEKNADRDCKGWLSMARNYIRAGMPEKAIPYLKQVIERYGDTRYAKQARDLNQEALQMIKARSEQEKTPSGHRQTKPEMQHKKQ